MSDIRHPVGTSLTQLSVVDPSDSIGEGENTDLANSLWERLLIRPLELTFGVRAITQGTINFAVLP